MIEDDVKQIAKLYVSDAEIRHYLNKTGYLNFYRERADLAGRCALHLADLYRHHGRRVRDIIL
jgi:hypothetical protein